MKDRVIPVSQGIAYSDALRHHTVEGVTLCLAYIQRSILPLIS